MSHVYMGLTTSIDNVYIKQHKMLSSSEVCNAMQASSVTRLSSGSEAQHSSCIFSSSAGISVLKSPEKPYTD